MTARHLLRAALICAWGLIAAAPVGAGQYQNFNVAIYVAVGSTRQLADARVREQQYERIASQLKFDKVYLEVYRDRQIADEASLDGIKKFFTDHGVAVAGGVTLAAGGQGGQFGTFDYEDPNDREECRRAVELAARHFDEIILDDFFFYTSKSAADIAAKGNRSWTQYRLAKMREATTNLVLVPARKVNPRVKVIIKYPNWYEHFQGLGYDLDVQAKQFDAIYTGTESRDPYITDQLLQQYLSYSIFRYFDNVRPGGANRGGWVDTFSTRYIDRYAEQLWDTLFAKAPEITLFNWAPFASSQSVQPGDRAAWADQATSFVWNDMVRSFKAPAQSGAGPGWARAAGYSLEQIDPVIGRLGKPIGVASYKPYQSSGEDFLHTYLGNIGIPIELTPTFPEAAPLVLLAESAKHDPDIVRRIKKQLTAGKSVVITSGLLRALQKSIDDIVELEYIDHRIAIREFLNAYGAGNGTSLNDPAHDNPPVIFPEIRFLTNDSWTLIRGVANAKGFPILLMNRYSRGVLYVLTIPDNIGDLYSLPQGVTNVIKAYLQPNFPVRIDAPSGVSLFAYDNGTFVVQSFLPTATLVKISAAGAGARLRNLVSTQVTTALPPPALPQARRRDEESPRSNFVIEVPPHSYAAFAAEAGT
jgi:hypothetical protein